MARRLYDTNRTITVGGRDYGVLRLSFAPDLIAGRLWEQTLVALALALFSVVGGLILIRYPLVRWLGNLGRIQAFDQAMRSGDAAPALLLAEEAPLEFRETFEVLGRAAANLQSQRVQAAVTLGAIADGVFTLDPEGRVLLANPAACGMTGRHHEDARGMPVAELLPALFADAGGLEPWARRRASFVAADGREVIVDTSLSPISGPDGSSAGFVLACRDVSEQHALDQRLHAELKSRASALISLRHVLEGLTGDATPSPAAPTGDDLQAISIMIAVLVSRLQIRSEQLNAIFELSPDGFVSFDAQRRVNYVSPAFSRLTGFSQEAVLGRTERQIEALLRSLCGPDMPWRGLEAMRQDLDHADPATNHRERLELARPAERVLELGLREGHSEVISQVLSLRDVTHETEVERMKSEFLSTAAHELRTPMASIYGFSELMSRRKLSPERQAEVIATIHRQSELMIAIVNELLDLARIEARRDKDFELETVELSALVDGVLNEFRPPQDRSGPSRRGAAAGLQVRVDRNKMRQALGNVLSNAYKYSPAGGAVQVALSVDADRARMVGIEVTDAGIGMTAEQLARVSERFYRADASGNIPGTGLGMSIVKEIIELHGGRLQLTSTPGQGSTVTLWLPMATAAVAEVAEEVA